jgi:hypothetical protein
MTGLWCGQDYCNFYGGCIDSQCPTDSPDPDTVPLDEPYIMEPDSLGG